MFKKLILFVSSMALIVMTIGILAKDKTPMVKLYEKNSTSKVITSLPPTAHFVPIIRKNGWVKVGVRPSGQVGWINLKQYNKVREAFYQPDIQTVYISSTKNKQGKPVVNIVAYRNGKKLSDKEAKAYYDQMVRQQRIQQHSMQNYWKHFNRMMRQQQRDMNQMMQSDLMLDDTPPIVVMPGPVLVPGKVVMPKD